MKRKWIPITLCAALVVTIGSFATYKSYAGGASKAQTLAQLKSQEKAERSKLEKMPNKTKAEMDATVQQGALVKEMSAQANKLEAELHPEETQRKRIEEVLYSVEAAYPDNVGYFEKLATQDPAKSAKALENLKIQKELIDRLKNDLVENKKSLAELQKQVDEVLYFDILR